MADLGVSTRRALKTLFPRFFHTRGGGRGGSLECFHAPPHACEVSWEAPASWFLHFLLRFGLRSSVWLQNSLKASSKLLFAVLVTLESKRMIFL